MLGIGMQEILIILVVALIVIGPKRLPELARTLGKGFAEFRKAADDLQETVRMDLQKERHEEFRQKYPHLVPDEDEEGAAPPSEGGTGDAKNGADVPVEGASGPLEPEPAPESSHAETGPSAPAEAGPDRKAPGGEAEDKPEPESTSAEAAADELSYDPKEIEGGDDTEDDTRNG